MELKSSLHLTPCHIRVPKVMGMLVGMVATMVGGHRDHHQPRVDVVDDGGGDADRPCFQLVGNTVYCSDCINL